MYWLALVMSLFVSLQAYSEEIDLSKHERRIISQNGEDGVIQKIFNVVGTTNKFYVDFGACDGHCCSNTKYLREKLGWSGVLMDGFFPDDPSINLHREFISAENICGLFAKYQVPQEFDFLSIDIDRNDFYVWKELSKFFRPRVVIIECNSLFSPEEDKVIRYSPNAVWDGSGNSGASVLALYNLGRVLGYSLVYQESVGVNLFFIRDDVLEACKDKFRNINNVKELYVRHDVICFLNPRVIEETFISSEEAIGGLK